jgi:hypothetical protein
VLDPTICVEGDCAEALALLSQMLDEDRDGAGLLTATVPPRGTWDEQIDTRTERDGQTYRQTDRRAGGRAGWVLLCTLCALSTVADGDDRNVHDENYNIIFIIYILYILRFLTFP